MFQFIETIRIDNGQIELLHFHNVRFNATRLRFFSVEEDCNLNEQIVIPKKFQIGLVKCRITYDSKIVDVQFMHYQWRPISKLKTVDSNISYNYKSADRKHLEQLKSEAEPADEVLIIKDGRVSDTSFSNIIFRQNGFWYTPDTPLLSGVRREYLLQKGFISERSISIQDIETFDSFMLVNAMLDFDDNRLLPIKNIIK